MAFGLIRALVAISFASHAFAIVPSAEVDRAGLQHHQQPPLETWDQTVKTFMEGKGSLIGRTAGCIRARDQAYAQYNTPQKLTASVNRELGWRDGRIVQGATVFNDDMMQDEAYAKFSQNPYPYRLPNGVTHYIFWLRANCVSEESFWNGGSHAFAQPPEVLMRYILHYDFFGGYGLSTNLDGVRLLEFQHPADSDVWVDPVTGIPIDHVTGIYAMKYAGRRINEIFQRTFPPFEYEVVWNRSPARYKSIHEPDHFHVLVHRKIHTGNNVYP